MINLKKSLTLNEVIELCDSVLEASNTWHRMTLSQKKDFIGYQLDCGIKFYPVDRIKPIEKPIDFIRCEELKENNLINDIFLTLVNDSRYYSYVQSLHTESLNDYQFLASNLIDWLNIVYVPVYQKLFNKVVLRTGLELRRLADRLISDCEVY